jgi:hypothetical protein
VTQNTASVPFSAYRHRGYRDVGRAIVQRGVRARPIANRGELPIAAITATCVRHHHAPSDASLQPIHEACARPRCCVVWSVLVGNSVAANGLAWNAVDCCGQRFSLGSRVQG